MDWCSLMTLTGLSIHPAVVGGLVACMAAMTLICGSLSAMIERSGPIRLHHWGQNAGGHLAALQSRPRKYEMFRLLLSFLARLSVAGLFGSSLMLAAILGLPVGVLIAAGVTSLVVVVSELINRVLVGHNPEEALERLTPLFRGAFILLQPLVIVLLPLLPSSATRRSEDDSAGEASEEEIEAFIGVGAQEGIIDSGDEDLILRAIDFGDSLAKSVMTPRMDMTCISADVSLGTLVDLFIRSKHSRIPIYEDSIDSIIGVIHLRDLLPLLQRSVSVDLRSVAHPPHFVPETKRLDQLLSELQALHQTLAVVVDEFGGTSGLVTIEDLLEEIVGEIVDEDEAAGPQNEPLEDGTWRIQARTSLSELSEIFGVTIEDPAYETVGGLIFGSLESVPKKG
ncbi:MAG: hemolysin family protein, partial [Thermoanaerobaculia bacterium]